ncbi:hypothetical protein DR864_19635 [Runella rosea]|uniref:Lipocalin-like domain-containing protein n=1 Tax=Runella rosea TaxID=2259595 RepID=A0A344TMC4_9BACT|nr:hypothetical protein [Runella rosea]AXE19795.1 hypothetical protein DR864_19635 [Runella rosea]
MKKLLSCSVLLSILVLNSGAGCGSKTEDPQPDNFQSLIGKWEAIRFVYEIVKQDGSEIDTGTELKSKGTVIIWEFFSDGRLVATQDGKSREVRWELKVKRLNGVNIDVGELKIIGTQEKQLAETLGQSGDLTYAIETSSEVKIMSLRVDATKIGPYKKNTLIYTYHKL